MQSTARKAVSPIIATLLLIAIAVAAGIIVYVYVNSLSGGLTQSGGQQMSDQLAMDAYNYGTISNGVTVTIRDTGSSSVSIDSIFFDGSLAGTLGSASGTCSSPQTTSPYASCTTGQTLTFTLTASPGLVESATSGTTHIIKIVTGTGGTSVFSVVAGRTG
jgi:archaeal type IV pilus assembly protein PilA